MFDVCRGVRQGDPLSAHLSITALKLLLNSIRHDNNIKGIMVENREVKLRAFAGDFTTFLQDIQSFERLFITLDRFGICAGLKLNTQKTEALWLGKCNYNPPHIILRKLTNL